MPDRLFEKLVANCAKPSESVSFLDHHLNRLLSIELPHRDRRDAESELPISRIALRSVLSEGLTDVIHYGKRCVGFEVVAAGIGFRAPLWGTKLLTAVRDSAGAGSRGGASRPASCYRF